MNLWLNQITTLEEFIAFIERSLGSEVGGDIELTLANFKDVISTSMKEYYRFFPYEGLNIKNYAIELKSGKNEYNLDNFVVYERQEGLDGQYKLIPITPQLFQVLDISPFNTYGNFMNMNGATDMNYEMLFFMHGSGGDGRMGMERLGDALNQFRNADYVRTLFQRKYYAEFDRSSNVMTVMPSPRADGFVGIQVAEYKPMEELFNQLFFQKLTVVNAKKQWGANFQRFDDISIDGGGTTRYKEIRQEGKEEHKEVLMELEEQRPPLMPFVE